MRKHLYLDMSEVDNEVRRFYGLSASEMFEKTRKRNIVKARQVFHYHCWLFCEKNLSAIGKYNGDANNNSWDHASVIHSRKTVKNHMDTDTLFRSEVEHITTRLNILSRGKINIDLTQEEKGDIIELILKCKSRSELSRALLISTTLIPVTDG